jgi:glycosyltransferase involved in cell wall biosynthesis
MPALRIDFCAFDQPGYVNGPNVWLQGLCRELAARGVDVRVLVAFRSAPGPTCAALDTLGIETEQVEWQPYTEDRIRWILERVAASPPDVFVANYSVAGYLAGRWIRAAGIPTIGVLHSDDAFHWGLVDQFVRGDERFRLSSVVCVSSFLADRLEGLAPAAAIVAKIPYGVPAAPRQASWRAGSLRVAYLGRLVQAQKRVHDVAAAFLRAAEVVPHFEGVLFGDGPEREMLARALEGSTAVRLGGRLANEVVADRLADFQAIALLSDFEGLPIALLEAMSAGVVPVCMRTRSGVEELVEHGSTGLLVDDRGAGFVAAIGRLADDPELWQRLSAGARRRVEQHYSSAANAESWRELCARLAAAAVREPPGRPPDLRDLPPVHPDLAREDVRDPGAIVRWLRAGRRRLSAGLRGLADRSPFRLPR